MQQEEDNARGYSIPDSGENFACPEHFANKYIQHDLAMLASPGKCSCCGEYANVVDIADIVEYLATKLTSFMGDIQNEDLYLASSFLDKEERDEGMPGYNVYGSYLKPKSENVYEDYLELAYDFDCLTDNDALNDIIASYINVDGWIRHDPVSFMRSQAMKMSWEYFVKEIADKFSALGLNLNAPYNVDNLLKHCKKDVGVYEGEDANSILGQSAATAYDNRTVIPKGTIIYRGRPDWSGNTYSSFNDLTSAPVFAAKANRMSQVGESVFYGSLDAETPIKEILNYCTVKPIISLGQFITTRDLNVIDLTSLPKPDFWMPGNKWQDVLFLNDFHNAITQAVTNQNQHVEYVPTQIFVNYIRTQYPDIDGIVFRSSLTSKPNVCLFYDNATSANIFSLVDHTVI